MSGGIALARTLIALNTSPLSTGTVGIVSSFFYLTTMGLTFLLAGLVIMVLSVCRYLSVQEQIIHHRYRPSGIPVMARYAITGIPVRDSGRVPAAIAGHLVGNSL